MFVWGIIVFLTAIAFSPLANAQWAQFCDDEICKERCGISVSLKDEGCLNETGRGSVKFHDFPPTMDWSLVASGAKSCPFQSGCLQLPNVNWINTICWDIAIYQAFREARSFRFITGGCPPNQY
ncbi:hypothetical protein F5Y16DRAFT_187082 [Xylariaceae sp. FL0255]|nr:hypothetical protein F5Y16DRAFT_187082 [Xylariaceae sp. FL0255]